MIWFFVFLVYFFVGLIWFSLEWFLLKREFALPVSKGLGHRLTKRLEANKLSNDYKKFCYIIIVFRSSVWPLMMISDFFSDSCKQ